MTITEAPGPPGAWWRKSSYSNAGNNCVEVATWRRFSRSSAQNACVEVGQSGTACAVRDSKNPEAGYLTFGERAWQAFVVDLKHGSYDL